MYKVQVRACSNWWISVFNRWIASSEAVLSTPVCILFNPCTTGASEIMPSLRRTICSAPQYAQANRFTSLVTFNFPPHEGQERVTKSTMFSFSAEFKIYGCLLYYMQFPQTLVRKR